MARSMVSISDQLAATGGRPTGFDYLRISLALAVIVWHSFGISYGMGYTFVAIASGLRPFVVLILPLFFALSGFLVAGSLERTKTISTFVGLRAIRIIPALAVESLLSALILGPLLTIYSLHIYFTSPVFFKYFLNLIGRIHYVLPGMFVSNPIPYTVNGQLWTIPWELKCYASLTLLALITVTKRPVILAFITIMAIPLWWYSEVVLNHFVIDPSGAPPGSSLVLSFLAAIVFYSLKRIVVWDFRIFLLCAATSVALSLTPYGDFFFAVPTAYCSIYLGLCNPKKIAILRGADYSYGLFLYGYVIQQFVAFIGTWTHHWYINLALTLPIATLFAAFSWMFIERPALGLKRLLPKIERWVAGLTRSLKARLPLSFQQRSDALRASVGKLKTI